MPKFGTKNFLFGYFWDRILPTYKILRKKQKCLNLGPKMPCLGIVGLKFESSFSYLKPAPSYMSNGKILRKNKNA